MNTKTNNNIKNKTKNKNSKTNTRKIKVQKIIETNEGILFVAKDNDWFLKTFTLSKQGLSEKESKICAYFDIKKTYRNSNNSTSFLIQTDNYEVILNELDFNKLEKFLGRPILNLKHTKILLDELIKRSKKVRLYEQTGWINQDTFLHPLIQHDDIEINLGKYQKLFVYDNSEKLHKIVKQLLTEGKMLGAKIALAVSSLFTEQNGFVVIDAGEKGIGKTLTSTIATNVFYKANNNITCHATKVAVELYLKTFTNLPVLLDEASLSSDDTNIEKTIFMLASGKGKARGNLNMTVDSPDLNNVLFITSEHEIKMDRLGAFRRFVYIRPIQEKDYTEIFSIKDLLKISKLSGCGTDYIKYLIKNKNKINENEFLGNYNKFNFTNTIERSVALLESFYQVKLNNIKNTIIKILDEQYKEVSKDLITTFKEKFTDFIAINQNMFRTNERCPSGQIWGSIEKNKETNKKEIYILTSVFNKFCADNNFPPKTILSIAKNKNMIKTQTKDEYRVIKRIQSIQHLTSCYCFIEQ